jgi:PAS domain S-box-containing protein
MMPSFKALIEHSSDVISILNPEGEVLYASPSSARVLGYLPEEMIGQNAFEFLHPKDRDHSQRALEEVLNKPPGPRQIEARVRQKNGDWCWVESTISNLLHEPPVAAILVNYREIGPRRAQTEQNRKQADDLARSHAVLEDFAYAIAHDLSEPLRSISLFTQMLVKEAQLDARGLESSRFILDGVARISTLLEGLDTFATRGFTDVPQHVEMDRVLADALHNLEHAITTHAVHITVGAMPAIWGNEKHLLRVFQNLISNAIKYRSEAPVEIHITAERMGAVWLIRVQDNGIGIAKENHERIFGLLKRLHGPEIPGVGIGLALCRKQVEGWGGTMYVQSELGKGSTFCFTIPALEANGKSLQTVDYRSSDKFPGTTRWRGIRRVNDGC